VDEHRQRRFAVSELPVVVVTGATGSQGGSVARHLLASGRWGVRALTRTPASDAACDLRSAGAEVVQGDFGDAESLRKACTGTAALFLVTNYWSQGGEAEYRHGRNMVEAALDAGIGHIVYSSLPETTRRSGGAFSVAHHDSKARLESELREQSAPASFVQPATYYENWALRWLKPGADGSLSFGLPHGDTPLAALAIEDLGGVVVAMLDAGERFHGVTVPVVGDLRPPTSYAEILTQVLGLSVRYIDMPREVYAASRPGARELAAMFEFSRVYLGDRTADLRRSRKLFPEIQTFEQWAHANVDAFAHLVPSP
jgi:uncharacterized protein YbjT (DUF2867 family)